MQARKKHGKITAKMPFTLVELMVVLIIIGILMAALAPAFNRLMTGNAVGAAERMISGQLSLARAEAVKRRCKVAIVFDQSNSLRAAYEDRNDVWQWLPGNKQAFLPTGALIGNLTTTEINSVSFNNTPYVYPLPKIPPTNPLVIAVDATPYPAIVFKKNGQVDHTYYLSIIEAVVPKDSTTLQHLNKNYCRVLTISQYTGKISIGQVNKP